MDLRSEKQGEREASQTHIDKQKINGLNGTVSGGVRRNHNNVHSVFISNSAVESVSKDYQYEVGLGHSVDAERLAL